MALSTDRIGQSYAQAKVASVKQGNGPWGAAIRYWLPRRNMRNADLARASGIQEKTVSSMARGFHTTTRKLEAVAKAFKVPLDQVLVSPDRQKAIDDDKRMIAEAIEMAYQAREEARHRREDPPEASSPGSSPATLAAAREHYAQEVERASERARGATTPTTTRATPIARPATKKTTRRK